jgi:uncharacterized cupredoxin-like copper-binding protein
MTQAVPIIKPFSLLLFRLFFLTLVFLGFNQFALAQAETGEERVTVILKDFSVRPDTTQAKAGRLTLEAVNEGMSLHELVILRTDLDPAELPRKEAKPNQAIGTEYLVNEDDARMNTIDEIEEFPAGTSQQKTVVLDPGHYVLFCNIPGHYDKGMYASLHITP